MSLSSYVSSLATRVAQEFKTIRTELAGKVSTGDSRLTDQRTPLDNSVTSAKIVNGTIVDSDISSVAAISSSKISGLGTAAAKDIPATGNASATQVVYGSDTRLTDQRTPLDNSVTSAKIVDGTIVNSDISASAAIASSKISFPANTPTKVVDNGDGTFTITF